MKSPHHRDLENYQIIQDPEDGYFRLDPIPSEEVIKAMYTTDYYKKHYPGWVRKTLGEEDYWDMVFDERFEIIERFITERPARILDIGSFLGLFLRAGKRRGWEVLGIEPSEQGAQYANQHDIKTLQGSFEDFGRETLGKFQAISLMFVLEHVCDPKAVLQKVHDLLHVGGVICVDVPNDFNRLQKAVRETLDLHQYWVAPPHHINYFSFESLSELFGKCGFNVIKRYTDFPMEFFLLMGDDYIRGDATGRRCHSKRMNFERRLWKAGLKGFKEKLYGFFSEEGVGRNIVLFGQKTE